MASDLTPPRGKLKHIPLSQIKEPQDPLRVVDKKKTEYLELVDSVRDHGVMNPIVVREMKDTPETPYSIIEGLHRYTAAVDAGLTEIPCNILTMSESEVWEAQIIGNLHRIETKPADYAKALARIFKVNQTMTKKQLSAKLNKSPTWLENQLKLNKLPDNVKKLVNDGAITLSNAYALTNLTDLAPEEIENYLTAAQTTSPNEFADRIDTRARQIRAERKQGRTSKPSNEFQPNPSLQSKSMIENEMNDPKLATSLLEKMGVKTPLEAWVAALKWTLKLDPVSLAAAEEKWNQERQAAKAAKEQRQKEREQKELADAAKMHAEASA